MTKNVYIIEPYEIPGKLVPKNAAGNGETGLPLANQIVKSNSIGKEISNVTPQKERQTENAIKTYGNLLYRTAYVLLGNPHDVQDVLQETFIKYMEKAPDFHDSGHEKAWLLKVTANPCKDYLRFSRRHAYADLESLENICAVSEQKTLLKEIIALPEKWKTVLLLHYVEGYGIKEIARIAGLTESAVKKRLQRGRDALRKQLTESEELYGQFE